MPYKYSTESFRNAIDEYRNLQIDTMINAELKYLSRDDIPEYDIESQNFLEEVLQLAKKYNNQGIIAKCQEVSTQMNKTGKGAYAETAILEDSLVTENDCLVLIEKLLNNDQYQSGLTKIVEFIKKKRSFHTAYHVLKKIHEAKISNRIISKEDVALYFIERMQIVINEEVKLKSYFGLHYKSETWGKDFKNDDYVHYHDLAKKYIRRR